jgi:hypothetical protein
MWTSLSSVPRWRACPFHHLNLQPESQQTRLQSFWLVLSLCIYFNWAQAQPENLILATKPGAQIHPDELVRQLPAPFLPAPRDSPWKRPASGPENEYVPGEEKSGGMQVSGRGDVCLYIFASFKSQGPTNRKPKRSRGCGSTAPPQAWCRQLAPPPAGCAGEWGRWARDCLTLVNGSGANLETNAR